MPKRKPVVNYRRSILLRPKVGERACVFPVNHPDRERVSNETYVITSAIVEVFSNGEFHTENTIYRPLVN